ncbi:MAG: hypothetical protein ACJAUO_002441, partial [Sediminicola sp.]
MYESGLAKILFLTINHQPSTINHQPSTINHQLIIRNKFHGSSIDAVPFARSFPWAVFK